MESLWNNLKLLLLLYIRPQRAMSDIMDRGSWLFGVFAVVIVSIAFQYSVNSRIDQAFGVPRFDFRQCRVWNERQTPPTALSEEEFAESEYRAAYENYQKALRERRRLPIVGDYGFWLFSFNNYNFLAILLGLVIFYVPATILVLFLFEPFANYSLVFRRDYGIFLTCTMMAWSAAHFPFAIAGLVLRNQPVDPYVFLAMWLASGLIFGFFMVFALRTVFGARWWSAAATVCLSWLSLSLGARIFNYISPFFFSPFLLFFIWAYLRGEISSFGNSFRERQNFRRFLSMATLNPHDAEARVQLGIIYRQRRQMEEALRYFNEALAIDPQEIDANYEMGKIAREEGNLQKALEHFSIVAEQNDKYALNEIWREIGATYLDAKAYAEAREFLEKFIERRPFDPEGLYYLGAALKALDETDKAREMFRRCLEAVQTSPDYRRGEHRKWARLAQKQLAA